MPSRVRERDRETGRERGNRFGDTVCLHIDSMTWAYVDVAVCFSVYLSVCPSK